MDDRITSLKLTSTDEHHAVTEKVSLKDRTIYTFDMPKIRKPEYWQFLKLVAPGPQSQLPPGQNFWTQRDAKEFYCQKCKGTYYYKFGTSQSVANHMNSKHKQEVMNYRVKLQLTPNKKIKLESKRKIASLKERREEFQKKCTDMLVDWICKSHRFMDLDNDLGLFRFIEQLQKGQAEENKYFVPPQELFVSAISTRARSLMETAKQELIYLTRAFDSGVYFSISLSFWTQKESVKFVAVMLHTLNMEYVPVNVPLTVEQSSGFDLLKRLEEWKLRTENLTGLAVKSLDDIDRDDYLQKEVALYRGLNSVLENIVIRLLLDLNSNGFLRRFEEDSQGVGVQTNIVALIELLQPHNEIPILSKRIRAKELVDALLTSRDGKKAIGLQSDDTLVKEWNEIASLGKIFAEMERVGKSFRDMKFPSAHYLFPALRALQNKIDSQGSYTGQSFVRMVDEELDKLPQVFIWCIFLVPRIYQPERLFANPEDFMQQRETFYDVLAEICLKASQLSYAEERVPSSNGLDSVMGDLFDDAHGTRGSKNLSLPDIRGHRPRTVYSAREIEGFKNEIKQEYTHYLHLLSEKAENQRSLSAHKFWKKHGSSMKHLSLGARYFLSTVSLETSSDKAFPTAQEQNKFRILKQRKDQEDVNLVGDMTYVNLFQE
eukprot:snap_masked-scaffold_22-processed-gene-4.36-mRNA-1 protein AED:0.44 eAED:0.45 QI:0/-1/0/1/-1/1/1/0/658